MAVRCRLLRHSRRLVCGVCNVCFTWGYCLPSQGFRFLIFFFFVFFSFLSFVMLETSLFLVGAGRVNPDRISKIFYIPSKKRGLSDNFCRMCNLIEIN